MFWEKNSNYWQVYLRYLNSDQRKQFLELEEKTQINLQKNDRGK